MTVHYEQSTVQAPEPAASGGSGPACPADLSRLSVCAPAAHPND